MLNTLELLCLAAIWGSSYLFMRMASPELGPAFLIFLRVGIGALALAPALLVGNNAHALRTHWRHIAIVGLSNSAIPFVLLAWSLLYLSAGLNAILTATTPIWAAIIAAWLFGGTISASMVVGMAVSLAGIVILVGGALPTSGTNGLLAALATLAAAACYGYAANHSKRHLAGVSPLAVAAGSQIASALSLAPIAVACWPRHAVHAQALGYAVTLGLVCTAFAYILYFRILERAGVAIASSVTLLIPLFGVLWGVMFLGESVTRWTLAGGLLTMVGLCTALAHGSTSTSSIIYESVFRRLKEKS